MKLLIAIPVLFFSLISFGQEMADEAAKSSETESELNAEAVNAEVETISESSWIRPNLVERISRKLIQKSKRISNKRFVKFKKSFSMDWDWAAWIFIFLGGLLMVTGFVFIILTTILPWWWFLIGIGTILIGYIIMGLGFGILAGKPGGVFGAAIGMIITALGSFALLIWGIVELIIWLVG